MIVIASKPNISRFMRNFYDSEAIKDVHIKANSQLEPVCVYLFPKHVKAFTQIAHELNLTAKLTAIPAI